MCFCGKSYQPFALAAKDFFDLASKTSTQRSWAPPSLVIGLPFFGEFTDWAGRLFQVKPV
jgi:hypothetical protein